MNARRVCVNSSFPMDIDELLESLKAFGPLRRKRGVSRFMQELASVSDFGRTEVGIGDDAAAIRLKGAYLLLAADGMMPGYVRGAPYHAGKSSILVNVNDIYAMGGRPLAVVDVAGGGDEELVSEMIRGLREGAEKFRVPIVGGHYHPDSEPSLAVAILGMAKRLLRGDRAGPGEDIVAAYALSGRPGPKAAYSFDAFSDKAPEELIRRREVLCEIAERGFANSCRDISNGGIIGALLAVSENSKVGFDVDIEAVPRPEGMALKDWLVTFPSYGFVLSASKEHSKKLLKMFDEVGANAAVIGKVRHGAGVRLEYKGQSRIIPADLIQGAPAAFRAREEEGN